MRSAQTWVQQEAHDQMRRGIRPTNVVVDTKMSTIKPHIVTWPRKGFQYLSNANIMDGWACGGYLACWQPEL